MEIERRWLARPSSRDPRAPTQKSAFLRGVVVRAGDARGERGSGRGDDAGGERGVLAVGAGCIH